LAADDESNVALAWFSGNTKTNDRGALMMYIPADNFYWAWYAELQRGKSWRITKAWEIKREDLAALMEERSDSLVEASFAAIQDSRRSKISAQIALVPRG
jgi:thiamine kinase-like enzyme